MRYLMLIPILLTIFTVSSAQACENSPTQLERGMIAIVTPGQANNVRMDPTTNSEIVGTLAENTPLTVLDGPICADGFNWYQVENTQLGIAGYTVEGNQDEFWIIPASLEQIAQYIALDFSTIAGDVVVEIMPPEQENFSMGREPSPQYIDISLQNPLYEKRSPLEILIFSMDEYKEVNPTRHEWMMQQGDAFLDSNIAAEELFIATTNSHHPTRISNNWMTGVRYISSYRREGVLMSYDILYQFSGITHDRRYWIEATLPISSEAIDYQFVEIEFEYERNDRRVMMQEFAKSLSEDDFYPLPTALDDVVRSLNVHGADGMSEPITSRLPQSETIDLSSLGNNVVIDSFSDVRRNEMYFIGENDTYPGWMVVRHRSDYSFIYESHQLAQFFDLMQTRPTTIEKMPTLNNIVDNIAISPLEYIDTDMLSGVFFFATQSDQVVTQQQLRFFQGITHDREYIIIGFFEVEFDALPESTDDLSPDLLALVNSDNDDDFQTYIDQLRSLYDSALDTDFSPPLDNFRDVIASYAIGGE